MRRVPAGSAGRVRDRRGGELNDLEIVWLRSYLEETREGDREFRSKHEDVLNPISPAMGSSEAEMDNQKSYKEHLNRLRLLEPRYEIDPKTKQPVFDHRGGFKIRGYEITRLGRLLLRQIELGN
jgi:hypothetical protein